MAHRGEKLVLELASALGLLFRAHKDFLRSLAHGDVRGDHQAGISAIIDQGTRRNLNVNQSPIFFAMFPDAGSFSARRCLRRAFQKCGDVFWRANVFDCQ